MKPLLSPERAAEELCISTKQLRALTCAGAIRYVNIGLGAKRETRRYDPEDLHAFREGRSPKREEPPAYEWDGARSPIFAPKPLPEDATGKPGSKHSYVYFIMSAGRVKIGFARSIRNRLNAIQSGSPYPVRLIHYEMGGRMREQALHRKFKAQRDRLEWFRIEGALEAFLGSLA